MAWPSGVSGDADLYKVTNNLETTLASNIDAVVTTVPLTDATNFQTSGGFVTIDSEIIYYTSKSGNDLTGCTRGADNTTAASHTSGKVVAEYMIAAHHNRLKDELITIETNLETRIGTGTTQVKVPSGTSGAPGLAFGATPAIGIYRPTSTSMAIVVNSTPNINLDSSTKNIWVFGHLKYSATEANLSSNLTINATDLDSFYIITGLTGADRTIFLPSAVSASGRTYTFKTITTDSNSFNITLDFGASTLEGSSTYVISNQYTGVTLFSSGSAWHRIANTVAI